MPRNPIANGIENRKIFPGNLVSFRREIDFCFRRIAREKISDSSAIGLKNAAPKRQLKLQCSFSLFKTDRNRFKKISNPIVIDVEKS
jgi:hypothetical protein